MACMVAHCSELVDGGVSNADGEVQRQQWGSHSGSCASQGLCSCPSKTTRGNGDDDGDGGDHRERGVAVGSYRGEVADVMDVSAVDFARGRGHLEDVHSVVRGVRLEIRSRN